MCFRVSVVWLVSDCKHALKTQRFRNMEQIVIIQKITGEKTLKTN